MRIFLDVGSNIGETISVVLNPIFKIDRVYGFEPSSTCCKILNEKFSKNSKVVILNFGLWNKSCIETLYNEGTVGATVHSDYTSAWKGFGNKTLCSFVKASTWFKENLGFNDDIILKLNCEGCECDIVNDLIDTGEFNKLKGVLIDYDVRKSPSQSHKQKELEDRLLKLKITNVYKYKGKDLRKSGGTGQRILKSIFDRRFTC